MGAKRELGQMLRKQKTSSKRRGCGGMGEGGRMVFGGASFRTSTREMYPSSTHSTASPPKCIKKITNQITAVPIWRDDAAGSTAYTFA